VQVFFFFSHFFFHFFFVCFLSSSGQSTTAPVSTTSAESLDTSTPEELDACNNTCDVDWGSCLDSGVCSCSYGWKGNCSEPGKRKKAVVWFCCLRVLVNVVVL
jgi:hypothetical protein